MRFKINKSIAITSLLVIAFMRTSYAQIAAAFYAGSLDTKVAVGYDFSPEVWADLRLYGGVTQEYFTPELTINYNFVRSEVHDVYAGAGFLLMAGTP